MAIRWKRNVKSTGLAAIGAMPRGWTLEDSETGRMYLYVYAEDRSGVTWRFGIVRAKTGNLRSKTVFSSVDDAKAAGDKYWKTKREEILAYWAAYDAERIDTRS